MIGRVRSCAYAFTLQPQRRARHGAAGPARGRRRASSVEVLGEPVAAQIAPDVLYDPAGERLLA